MINKGLMSSNKSDWETPHDLFTALNQEFYFTLDAAASEHNAKLENYYTKEDDALSLGWQGRVWLNPPYGREISMWVKKAYVEGVTNAAFVVVLLPARTDTRYFHDYIMLATEIRFIKGRLRFVGAPASAPFPSMIVVFDQNSGEYLPRIRSADTLGRRIEVCLPGVSLKGS